MVTGEVVTATGSVLQEAVIQEFRTSLLGELICPGDEGYDAVRKVWNAKIDRHPAMIVRCSGVADVINVVNFARDNTLLTAVRGGGHNVTGSGVCEGGIVIDLTRMKGMRVDPAGSTARAQPGLTWGEFDREAQAFGLGTPGGVISTTGIAGLTLGGGFGWLTGKYGLSCDNLLSADVVTAEGRFVTASGAQNQDLFWGLRGGGGNFGVVTSFEYQLHPVGPVLAGMICYPLDKARELLRFYRDYTSMAPDELSANAMVLSLPGSDPVVAIALCYSGPIPDGECLLKPLKAFGQSLLDLIRPMRYIEFQTIQDFRVPYGVNEYDSEVGFLKDLSDEALDTFLEFATSMPSELSVALLEHFHGAANRVGADQTAFVHRDRSYVFELVVAWDNPAESERQTRWAGEFSAAMRPFSTGGVYVNFLAREGEDWVRAAYGSNYDRLVALKNKYDPANFFRVNHNIKPTV